MAELACCHGNHHAGQEGAGSLRKPMLQPPIRGRRRQDHTRSEDNTQKSEDNTQKSEDNTQKSEDHTQKSEDHTQSEKITQQSPGIFNAAQQY
jgi:hypothetical protein